MFEFDRLRTLLCTASEDEAELRDLVAAALDERIVFANASALCEVASRERATLANYTRAFRWAIGGEEIWRKATHWCGVSCLLDSLWLIEAAMFVGDAKKWYAYPLVTLASANFPSLGLSTHWSFEEPVSAYTSFQVMSTLEFLSWALVDQLRTRKRDGRWFTQFETLFELVRVRAMVLCLYALPEEVIAAEHRAFVAGDVNEHEFAGGDDDGGDDGDGEPGALPRRVKKRKDLSHINFIPRGEIGGDEDEGGAAGTASSSSSGGGAGAGAPLMVEVSAGTTFIFEVCCYVHTLEQEMMRVKTLRGSRGEGVPQRVFEFPQAAREAGMVANHLYDGVRKADVFTMKQGFRRYAESLMLLDCDSRIFKERHRDRKFPSAGDVLRFKNDVMCDIGNGDIAEVARRHPRLWMDYMVFAHVRDIHQQNLMNLYGLPLWYDEIDVAPVERPGIFRCIGSNEYCVVKVDTQWDVVYVFATVIEAFCWLRMQKLLDDVQVVSSAESGEKLADAFAADLFDGAMKLK